MNDKKCMKMGPQGARLIFLCKVSIVVLIDFIAILLTPGIFLIQIVKTKPKSWVLKFQTNHNHSSQRDEINCVA